MLLSIFYEQLNDDDYASHSLTLSYTSLLSVRYVCTSFGAGSFRVAAPTVVISQRSYG